MITPEISGSGFEKNIHGWRSVAKDILGRLGELTPDVTPDGKIYVVQTPDELEGDFALVDMSEVTIDTPHYHTGGEVEVHFPVRGSTLLSVGRNTLVNLVYGTRSSYTVAPETPHFVVPHPGTAYMAGVLSLPKYNEDNLITIDPNSSNPHPDFNQGFYWSVKSRSIDSSD